jgi:hypothetical protein
MLTRFALWLNDRRTPMKRDQINRIGMGNTVSTYTEKNKSTWAGNKAIAAALADLNTVLAAIAAAAGKQQTPISGVVEEKEMVRHDLEEKILEIAAQLSALADVVGDVNLGAQVEFTLSGLDKLSDDQLEAVGKRVSAAATAKLTQLADYDVTQEDITELDSLITRFNSVKNAPRISIAGRAGETATLPRLIADMTSLLRNRLDKLMLKYRKSNPEFYAGYLTARVIVDRGGSTSAAKPAAAAVASATATAVK